VLSLFTHGSAENCERFGALADALGLTVEVAMGPSHSEARVPACELFVGLVETVEVEARRTLERAGGRSCLEAIAGASDIGDALAARAKVALQSWAR